MRIHILTVCQKVPTWIEEGYREYQKRLPRDLELIVKEIKPQTRGARISTDKIKEEEAKKILEVIPGKARVIVMDERGKALSTQEWADRLSGWQLDFPEVAFVIGGSEGLSDKIRQRADEIWALSKMTFPHALVRVLIAEQIYRAWTVLQGHPYHRE